MITTEQLQERVNYLGGSDASAILGLSRWKTPLSVFMAKVFPKPSEEETKIGGKMEAAYWGNKLEDKVCEAFTEVTGKKVYRVNETLVHPQYPFIRANIDRRVVGEDAGFEAKTASAYKSKEWEGEEMPIEYIIQCQHYMLVTNKPTWYLAVLIGGQKFIWKEIIRDEEIIKNILEAEVNFWENFVLKKQPPMVTGSDQDAQLLNRLYPEAEPEGKILMLPDEFEAKLIVKDEARSQIKDLEKAVTLIENEVKVEMKDHETAQAGKYKITWKNQSKQSVDSKKFKEEYPEVYDLVQRTSTSRVFRTKFTKEGKDNDK